MFQDIIRATVQRIFSDKILLGLLIVCLLGFFVGGFSGHKDEPPVPVKGIERAASPQTNSSTNSASQNQTPSQENSPVSSGGSTYHTEQLEPALAVDFVKWWMKAAMDYSKTSARQSHEAASNWMSPEAYKAFREAFWTEDLADQITSGVTVAAFQPIAVQAEAINPDHSVVVGLTGTLIMHNTHERPVSNQIQIDLLVRKGDTGLRIAGINNRVTTPSASTY